MAITVNSDFRQHYSSFSHWQAQIGIRNIFNWC